MKRAGAPPADRITARPGLDSAGADRPGPGLHGHAVHEEGFRVRAGPDGELTFERPDGRPLPGVPAAPVLPDDPVGAVVGGHRARGLEIDAWTPTPRWHGERLDLGLALTLRTRSGSEAALGGPT